MQNGFKHFGLQYYGECWALLEDKGQKYDMLGQPDQCVGGDFATCDDNAATECVGKANANYVYEIVEPGEPRKF